METKEIISAVKYLVHTQFMYVAYALPFIFFMLWFYLKNKQTLFAGFKGFIKWVKPSCETGGTSSPEKLTAFGVLSSAYVPGRLLFSLQVDEPKWLLLGCCLDAIFILSLFKIISPAQIIELRTGLKLPDDQQIIKKDEKTV